MGRRASRSSLLNGTELFTPSPPPLGSDQLQDEKGTDRFACHPVAYTPDRCLLEEAREPRSGRAAVESYRAAPR
jgi:hypothetical protein